MSDKHPSAENKELSGTQITFLAERGIDKPTWLTLKNSIFPGAKPESIVMAVDYCRARKLDILKKPCHIVPMRVSIPGTDKKEWRDVIMPGIAEYRTTAMRTGHYAGMDDPEWGETIEHDFGGTTIMAPEYCTVRVYRLIDGKRDPFPHTEWFVEAAATKSNGELNSMWMRRKRGQLLKCAEAGALRKAFPEELGGEVTAEELEGMVINHEKATMPQPQSITQLSPAESEAPISDEQIALVEASMTASSKPESELFAEFQVSSIGELTAGQLAPALDWLNQ